MIEIICPYSIVDKYPEPSAGIGKAFHTRKASFFKTYEYIDLEKTISGRELLINIAKAGDEMSTDGDDRNNDVEWQRLQYAIKTQEGDRNEGNGADEIQKRETSWDLLA